MPFNIALHPRSSDFMRQSARHQVVTGEHTYTNVSVDGSILPHPAHAQNFTINGIPVSSLVKKGSSVTFRGSKIIKKLFVVGEVNASLVNGVSVMMPGEFDQRESRRGQFW